MKPVRIADYGCIQRLRKFSFQLDFSFKTDENAKSLMRNFSLTIINLSVNKGYMAGNNIRGTKVPSLNRLRQNADDICFVGIMSLHYVPALCLGIMSRHYIPALC